MIRWTSAATILMVAGLNVVPAAAAKRVVDSSDGQGSSTNCNASNAAYFSIATALTASSPGDQIFICPGSGPYNEQLSIDKAVTLKGILGATVRPSPMLPNTSSLVTGNPIAAAILIEDGVAGVVIDQLTIDGSGNGIAGCSPNLIGVYYRNSSGTVKNSVVKNFRLGTGLEGCQSGLGIFAQSGAGTSNVTVSNTSVHDFQKNGITGNESGTTLTATNNQVTGDGPTPSIAQNGIQIGFGAKGTITNNLVSEVVYSLCVDPSAPGPNPCDNGSSTGILVYQGATPTTVSSNTVTTTQTGVYLDANGSSANANLITRTLQYDGIYLPAGADGNTVSNNGITNSDESGIWVDGTSNIVTKNSINEAPIGIHAACGNTVPTSGSTRNTFYNVPLPTDDAGACVLGFSGAEAKPAAHASPVK
jgi:parallel beta-helix repeat protein